MRGEFAASRSSVNLAELFAQTQRAQGANCVDIDTASAC
jgi:hypothetical protein